MNGPPDDSSPRPLTRRGARGRHRAVSRPQGSHSEANSVGMLREVLDTACGVVLLAQRIVTLFGLIVRIFGLM